MDHRSPTPPVILTPSLRGPHELYFEEADMDQDPCRGGDTAEAVSPPNLGHRMAPESVVESVTTAAHVPDLSPNLAPMASPPHTLYNARSNPALSASRQAGRVKDMASRIDHGQASATVRTSRDRYRQPAAASKIPTSGMPSNGEARKPHRRLRSPRKSTSTSFDSSFSSATTSSTIKTTHSQPQTAFRPPRTRSPNNKQQYMNARPLFGEITADGRWNGNFVLEDDESLSTFERKRRSSEGSLALGRGRSQSQQDISISMLAAPIKQKLSHRRSRSDMDALQPQVMPSMPNLSAQNPPSVYPTPPDSASRTPRQSRQSRSSSRIPISSGHQSFGTSASLNAHSRTPSAISSPTDRRRPEVSPTRKAASGRENGTTRSHQHSAPLSPGQTGQTLSAKIVAPLPKTSPPLRSSRPRQPVSSATTSASRARAAERFHGASTSAIPRDGRRPSEQWLGKPYDPQKESSRRNIPELNKIDFEERRARIQRAISQSLKSTESHESLKQNQSRSASRSVSSRTTSRVASHDHGQPSGSEIATRFSPDLQKVSGTDDGEGGPAAPEETYQSRGLSVNTTAHLDSSDMESEPLTAQTDRTMFEDESPLLGRAATDPEFALPTAATDVSAILLAPVTYQPAIKATPADTRDGDKAERAQDISGLDDMAHLQKRSDSPASRTGIGFADDMSSAIESSEDAGDRWGLTNADQGSIRIMLDDDPNISHHSAPWSNHAENNYEGRRSQLGSRSQILHAQEYDQHSFNVDGYTESPINDLERFDEVDVHQQTPRKAPAGSDTFLPDRPQSDEASSTLDSDGGIARVLDYYSSTGTLTAEMLAQMQHRVLDLHRLSANAGSDANMIQSLLTSIMESHNTPKSTRDRPMPEQDSYNNPLVTPDTPPMDGSFEPGTVIVYGSDVPTDDDDDFEAKVRKADEQWERQQRGGADPFSEATDHQDRPAPPPKDFGYTPRSSAGPISTTFLPYLDDAGLQISTASPLDVEEVHAAGDRVDFSPPPHFLDSLPPILAPPLPTQPPPQPPADGKPPHFSSDAVLTNVFPERGSGANSPPVQKANWANSGSSRPSMDSQNVGQQFPTSQSVTSIVDTARHPSIDTSGEDQTRLTKSISPGPEQKRLLRRRNILKELLDTENSYHQDLKIIEDIYKATCTPELVAAEDKKVLFGNCDDVEKFALQFYDELRRSATHVYVPPKQQRYMNNKRSSFSTTQSDGTTQTTSDGVDDERDRMTKIGHTFLGNLSQMEKVYGTYLKNHDAANQRLSAIQSTPTVKCWLDECHANASDITTAWNLDSLLVKPTQRVAKYPMLLKDLLEVTPSDHPDHENLQSAAKDIIAMLTRINEAKKRADIVDQMINKGKHRKDSDLRGGLSKAFGRRTEKLKERVGIAEAFQDMEFDELAHKFGGHFIRLQICMRDVQDYVHRAEQGIALVNAYVESLELFTDLHDHQLAEITSKWRRYGQIIRELTLISFGDHKAAVQKRVLAPMIQCIKLHEGPQAAINKRKKKIVDYAKCRSDERRGQKPDKKTQEASDAYVALNETLKAELPQLYKLTAKLVQNCLHCFLDIQLKWHSDWERKLRPVLDAADIPSSIQQIVPAFRPDFAEVEKSLTQLSICNGTLKIEAANFLSPTMLADKSDSSSTLKSSRPPTLDSSKRTLSVGSESSTAGNSRRQSGIYNPSSETHLPLDNRIRSNSSMSNHGPTVQTPGSSMSASRPWSHSNTPSSSFSMSRPGTGNPPPSNYYLRQSSEIQRSPRPESHATYFTARPDTESLRFSGLFTSALPPEVGIPQRALSPARAAPEDMHVLFACASLFEFSIDRTRKEAGYPYLQYVQGEIFDVVAQKGELWLAKNQDDPNNELGWIWEQHFIILSSE